MSKAKDIEAALIYHKDYKSLNDALQTLRQARESVDLEHLRSVMERLKDGSLPQGVRDVVLDTNRAFLIEAAQAWLDFMEGEE